MPDLDPKTPLKDALGPDDKNPLKTAAVLGSRKAPVCPQCGLELDVYEGDNPHKQGTGWCPTHGRQLVGDAEPPPAVVGPVAA